MNDNRKRQIDNSIEINSESQKNVYSAFKELRESCIHRDMNDCGHPDIDFKCMSCSPSNCPLLYDI
jgi:hypothetical protein